MATVEFSVRIFANVWSERLYIIIDMNRRENSIPIQLETIVMILINR